MSDTVTLPGSVETFAAVPIPATGIVLAVVGPMRPDGMASVAWVSLASVDRLADAIGDLMFEAKRAGIP